MLAVDLPWLDNLVQAKTHARLLAVLTPDEVRAVLAHRQGVLHLMASLLYGGGLRLLECCCLRVKDVDFRRHQLTVRRGKGDQDRMTMLPAALTADLVAHLARIQAQNTAGLTHGASRVELPHALATLGKLRGDSRSCASGSSRRAQLGASPAVC